MLKVNMRFNLAIHLPLRWIAALFYLFRVERLQPFGGMSPPKANIGIPLRPALLKKISAVSAVSGLVRSK